MTDRVSYKTIQPGVVVVVLEGEHELYGATRLQESLEALLEDADSVTVDLRQADFIDSSVVGVLLYAQRRAAERDVDYTILVGKSTGEPVRRMFEVTGLTRILPLVERTRP